MVRKAEKIIAFLSAFLFAATALSAQETEQADSLVRLVKAKSIEMYDQYGRSFRKAIDATFLHNGTYLICDTALWNVDSKIINSWGNVQLVQDETILTSEKLDYFIDNDLAQFRGGIVQLKNKKDNILRTRNLDYNTKDSTAVFRGGGAMRDQDGQVIESQEGTYNSKTKVFTFTHKVNMYTDSVFVKTTDLVYDGESNTAEFVAYVDFWKEHNMLSAGYGWYHRDEELFFFERGVHGLSQNQEVWCDSLFFHRNTQDVDMFGNVHIQDSSRNVAGMARKVFYCDSIARITMMREAAVAMQTEQQNNNSKIDTLYMGADSIVYYSVKNCDVDSVQRVVAKERLNTIMEDPVGAFRARVAKEAAEKAAKALEELAKKDQNIAGKMRAKKGAETKEEIVKEPEVADTLSAEEKAIQDSLDRVKAYEDSLALANDTSKVGFLVAVGKVKLYRSDMQVLCDSLNYTDLDSIARFFINPMVWNEGNRQYTSDSLFVLIKQGGIDRASLMSNAYIITQEDSLYYDQIRGADVMAYFDTTSALKRFDALGGTTALFFLKEDETIATVNKVECKMMSAIMKDGALDRVYYYEAPKNNAFPLAQLPETDVRMKGFNWSPEMRPKGRTDITSLTVKPSERAYYEARPRTEFTQTDIYFPGYMKSVYRELRDAKRRRREAARAPAETPVVLTPKDSLLVLPRDSVAAVLPADSVAVRIDSSMTELGDSLKVHADSLKAHTDSLKVSADSLLSVSDSLSHKPDSLLQNVRDSLDNTQLSEPKDTVVKTPEMIEAERKAAEKQRKAEARAQKKAEAKARREARREAMELRYKLRVAKRDAEWARLDSLDAIKDAKKAEKSLARKRAQTRREVMEQMQQDAKDQAKLEAYIKRYEKQKAREDARAERRSKRKSSKKTKVKDNEQKQFEPSGERAPEITERGEISTASEF